MKEFLQNGGNESKLGEVESKRPKKCLSAYMIFVRETWCKIQKDNPDMHVLQIMKEVGSSWQNLSPEERKVYQQKADEDKIWYRKQLKEFEKEVDKLELKKSTRGAEKRVWKKKTVTSGKRKRVDK